MVTFFFAVMHNKNPTHFTNSETKKGMEVLSSIKAPKTKKNTVKINQFSTLSKHVAINQLFLVHTN